MKIDVTGKKPPPAKPKPPPAPVSVRRTWWVMFKNEANVAVPAEEHLWLHKWWASLRPETRAGLKNGSTHLTFWGYTSTSDDATKNKERAQQRNQAVIDVLNEAAGMQGSKSLIKNPPETHAIGEGLDPSTTDERPKETRALYAKRVEVSVEEPAISGVASAEFMVVQREMIKRMAAKALEEDALKEAAAKRRAGARPSP